MRSTETGSNWKTGLELSSEYGILNCDKGFKDKPRWLLKLKKRNVGRGKK
jgi:hypothetical protein